MAFNNTGTYNGTGTFSITVPETGNFQISGKIFLPTIPEGESTNSSVVVTININGAGAFYTGVAGARGFSTTKPLTANDIINVILTSSAAVDQGLNKIKTTIVVVNA